MSSVPKSWKTVSKPLALLAVLMAAPLMSHSADRSLQLAWSDLQPAGEAEHNAKISAALTSGLYDAIKHRRVREYESEARKLREQLKAGTVPSLNWKRVRIPGYAVPLDFDDAGMVKEFLLVPFYGACIHVPAPPANQIVHVLLPRPRAISDFRVPIWVEGRLTVSSSDSQAPASYQLSLTDVQAYSGGDVPYSGPKPHLGEQ